MFPPGLEPGTFRVLGGCDNHYTTETYDKIPNDSIHATMKILKQTLAMKRRAHKRFSVYVVIVISREISFLAINTIVTTGYAFKH
uniref:Uncharacterized protein n=1 Tax=Glossina palpalis gambiensis TaxID=67801 RepID=A0A1B0AWV4_9MUSC